jgi:hypothetical protein
MIADSRVGYGFNSTPGGIVRLQKGLISSTIVLIIAKRKDSGKASIDEQVRGGFFATVIRVAIPTVEICVGWVTGDVSSRSDHRV